jgi:RNA polymerase sigma-70 factor (ECF subfamily)
MPSELEERFTQGDLEAFETLFRQFQREVYRWIVRIVRHPDIAEELAVETFWRIYRAHARFNPSRSFGAWARRIATNVALDHLGSAKLEVALPKNVGTPLNDPAIQSELRHRIERAFRQLPPDLQVAATLALIEEEPYEEIAEALAIPLGTVKSRVFRAVRLLRKKLRGFEIQL